MLTVRHNFSVRTILVQQNNTISGVGLIKNLNGT